MAVLRRHALLTPDFDARCSCQKREYLYYVPYRALLLPTEIKALDCPESILACQLWVAGLPDECDVAVLKAFTAHLVGQEHLTDIRLAEAPGSAILVTSSAAHTLRLADALDGAEGFPGAEGCLLALPEHVAAVWRGVHIRLRESLRSLTGRNSFHNFSPGFQGADDPKSIRQVYRCRSGITSGWHDVCNKQDFAVLSITGRLNEP